MRQRTTRRCTGADIGPTDDTCVQPDYWPAIRTFLAEEITGRPAADAEKISLVDDLDDELDAEGAAAGSVAP